MTRPQPLEYESPTPTAARRDWRRHPTLLVAAATLLVNLAVAAHLWLGGGGDVPLLVPLVANLLLGGLGLLATPRGGGAVGHISLCFALPAAAMFLQFVAAVARFVAEGGC